MSLEDQLVERGQGEVSDPLIVSPQKRVSTASQTSALSLMTVESSLIQGLDPNTPVSLTLADLLEFKRRIEAQMHVPDAAVMEMEMEEAGVIFSNKGIEIMDNTPLAESDFAVLDMTVTIRKGLLDLDFDASVSQWHTPETSESDPVAVFNFTMPKKQQEPFAVTEVPDEMSFQFSHVLRGKAKHSRMDDGQMMAVLKKLQLSESDSAQNTIARIAAALMSVLGKKAVVRDVLDVLFRAQGMPNRKRIFTLLTGTPDGTVIEPSAEYLLKEDATPEVIHRPVSQERVPPDAPAHVGIDQIRPRKQRVKKEKPATPDSINPPLPAFHAIVAEIAVKLAETLKKPVTVSHVRQHVAGVEDLLTRRVLTALLSPKHGKTKITLSMLASLPAVEVTPEMSVEDKVPEPETLPPEQPLLPLHQSILNLATALSQTQSMPVTVARIRENVVTDTQFAATRTAVIKLLASKHGKTHVTSEMLRSLPAVDIEAEVPAGDQLQQGENKDGDEEIEQDENMIAAVLAIAAELAETLQRPVTVADVRQHAIRNIEDSAACAAIMYFLSSRDAKSEVTEDMFRTLLPASSQSTDDQTDKQNDSDDAHGAEETAIDPHSLRAFVLQIALEITNISSSPARVKDLRDYFEIDENDGPSKRALMPLFKRINGHTIITPAMLSSTFPSNGKPSPLDMSLEAVQQKYASANTKSAAFKKGPFVRVEADLPTINRLREPKRAKHTEHPNADELDLLQPLSDVLPVASVQVPLRALGETAESEILQFIEAAKQSRGGLTSQKIHRICRTVCLAHADRTSVESVEIAKFRRYQAIQYLHDEFGIEDLDPPFEEDITLPTSKPTNGYHGPINTTIKFGDDPRFPNRAQEINNEIERLRLLKGIGLKQSDIDRTDDALDPETPEELAVRIQTDLKSIKDLVRNYYSADFSDGGTEPTDAQLEKVDSGAQQNDSATVKFAALGVDPYRPTKAKPGSEAKVLYLCARYAASLELWHRQDRYNHSSSIDKDVDGEYRPHEGFLDAVEESQSA